MHPSLEALPEVKAVVAQLAAARRNLVNVRTDGVKAVKLGVWTQAHANRLVAAERDLELVLECFLVAWGAWVEGVETGATPAKKDSYTAWVDGESL